MYTNNANIKLRPDNTGNRMSSNTTLKTKMISISGIHLYLTQSLPFHKLPITIKKKKKSLNYMKNT